MKKIRDRSQPDCTLYKDFIVLKFILENHFVQKNAWRDQAGLFDAIKTPNSDITETIAAGITVEDI